MSNNVLKALLVMVLGTATTLVSFLGFSTYDQSHRIEAEAVSKSWQKINVDGFAEGNVQPDEIASVGGELFAATRAQDPVAPGIWKHSYSGNVDSWTKAIDPPDDCSLGASNLGFTSITEFNGKMYVGTQNDDNGAYVYEFDPSTLAPGLCNNTAVTTPGGNLAGSGGLGAGSTFTIVRDFVELGGNLHAVVENPATDSTAIMRWTAGTTSWTQVNTGFPTGFGTANETTVSCDVVGSSTAYCGATNAAKTIARLYKSTDMTTWTQVGADDFGNANNINAPWVLSIDSTVYASISNDTDGVEVVSVNDNTAVVTKIGSGGLNATVGSDNRIAQEIGELNGMPFFGVGNDGGAFVYRYNKSGSFDEVSMQGFGDPNNNLYPVQMINHNPNTNSNNLYLLTHLEFDPAVGEARAYRFVDVAAPTLKSTNVGNQLDTNITFTLEDDETGVATSSVTPVITGSNSGVHTYTTQSVLAPAPNTNSRNWTFTLNPDQDFTSGETVTVSMTPCDRYVSQNCDTLSFQFQVLFQGSISVGGSTSIGTTGISDGTNGYSTGTIYTSGVSVIGATRNNGTAQSSNGSYVCVQPQTPFIVAGAGKTGAPHVRVFDNKGNETANFFAFSRNLKSGIRVSTADIDADGEDEIVVGSGEGAAPHVRVFERDGSLKPIDFRPFHPNSRTGVDVAGGDIDGDGKDEIIMSVFRNGETWVKVYRYNAQRTIVGEWVAYERGQQFGSSVSAGDIDDDGKAEIITNAGPTGEPHVRVFESDGAYKGDIHVFPTYAYPEVRRGMDVTVGDVNNDGKMEIGTTIHGQIQAWAKVYRWNEYRHVVSEIKPYNTKWVGANVSMGDLDGDCGAEILTGASFGGGPHVRGFQPDESPMSQLNFFAFDKNFRGGADIEVGGY